MDETYPAPELTEVGEFTADTLGDIGSIPDSLMFFFS
ncbi:lasso RiPP family leader peptide-containing protein [Saccharopolyspora cebuensis]|uniref:Lasso RiPP family leader peptide-containing protein n=1 Tax=Saccharopolyspora cebuensis TaxID=418759 RepID=A0ABV4CEG8_9PSEU